MDFTATSEQSMLQDSVRRTLAQLGQRRGPEVRQALADLGVLALPFPEEMGGLGGSASDTMLVMQEFGRALIEDSFLPAALFSGTLLVELGLEADAVAAIAEGSALTVFASSEPAGRGDVTFVQARARRDGDSYVLGGHKSVVLGANEAATILVSVSPEDGAFDGVGIVKLTGDTLPKVRAYKTIDGFDAADISLDGITVPADALIATNAGPAIERAAEAAIIAACAEALGAMEAGFWMTNEYLKTRQQFGIVIGTLQALQHRMADHFVDLEQARSMLYRGLGSLSASSEERARTVSAAKAYIGKIAKRFGADMIQLHGGIGVTEEHMIGHYYRRLLSFDARYGDCNHHLARVAGI